MGRGGPKKLIKCFIPTGHRMHVCDVTIKLHVSFILNNFRDRNTHLE